MFNKNVPRPCWELTLSSLLIRFHEFIHVIRRRMTGRKGLVVPNMRFVNSYKLNEKEKLRVISAESEIYKALFGFGISD